MFTKSAAIVSMPLSSVRQDAIAESLGRARTVYKEAAERLFILCCEIQASGRPPEPILLTKALARFMHAHAQVELLEDLRKTAPAPVHSHEDELPPR